MGGSTRPRHRREHSRLRRRANPPPRSLNSGANARNRSPINRSHPQVLRRESIALHIIYLRPLRGGAAASRVGVPWDGCSCGRGKVSRVERRAAPAACIREDGAALGSEHGDARERWTAGNVGSGLTGEGVKGGATFEWWTGCGPPICCFLAGRRELCPAGRRRDYSISAAFNAPPNWCTGRVVRTTIGALRTVLERIRAYNVVAVASDDGMCLRRGSVVVLRLDVRLVGGGLALARAGR